MKEYVEKNTVRGALFIGEQCLYSWDEIEEKLDAIPAADVRPVVRGKWKPRDLTWGRSYYYCSACEETVDMPTAMGIPMFCFCPNCGADMREES